MKYNVFSASNSIVEKYFEKERVTPWVDLGSQMMQSSR